MADTIYDKEDETTVEKFLKESTAKKIKKQSLQIWIVNIFRLSQN